MASIGRSVNNRSGSGRHLAGTTTDAAKAATETLREILQSEDRSRGARGRGPGHPLPDQQNPGAVCNQLDTAHAHTITVLVADDHPVVREGLVTLIGRQANMRVIGQAINGRESVEMYRALHPDVALLDIRMPVMDGIEAVSAICAEEPAARLVVVTLLESEEDIYRALRAGALGYVLKAASVEQLIRCIESVAEGCTWIPPEVGGKLAKRVTDKSLTAREMDVLRAVTLGKSNKEIGVAYNISEGTVKVHMTHIFEKLKVAGRTEAINIGVKRGLVRIDGADAA
jgi:two-component system NarL family response regulator